MNYAKAIEIALQKTDSELSDYDESIFPAIVDSAQMLIATKGIYIKRMYTVVNTEETEYILPTIISNFYQLTKIKKRGSIGPVNYYEYGEGQNHTLVLSEVGTIDIYYYALPKTIDENTADDYEFEVDLETHNAIPFYIGYELTKVDDPTIAQICLNEWDKYMSLFVDKPRIDYKRIRR